MADCLFCKIINKEIPSEIVYEDDRLLAFRDINPAAPVHILIIPKVHIASLNDLDETNSDIVKDIALKAKELAEKEGIAESGYRIINNIGDDGGQTVKHLHFHLMGGEALGWPI